MLAAQKGFIDIVQSLASQGANVDVLDTYGNRPLHMAASSGQLKLLKVLLAEGASLERPNKLSFTPLHVAVQNGQRDAVAMLLERRADPLASTNTLSSSLHLAARQGNKSILSLLLEHRADVDVAGLESATPLHFALGQGHGEVVEFLLSKGASVSGALHKAVISGNVTMVQELITRKADPTDRDGDGRTALHAAVSNPHIVDILVAARTPMTPDVSGKTPLHEAALCGSSASTSSLLNARGDPSFKDMTGKTPLDIARAELSKVWAHEQSEDPEGKHAEWFEWAHDQFGVSMANVAKGRDFPGVISVLEKCNVGGGYNTGH